MIYLTKKEFPVWTHKKYKTAFKSKMIAAGIDKVFQLTNGKVTKTFDSWQAAVKLGWEKQKESK